MISIPGSIKNAWDEALRLETYFAEHVFKNPSIVLEAEKVYSPYLLMEKKKRYVGRAFENSNDLTKYKLDTKGLECKRTDSSLLMKNLQKKLITCIMPISVDADVSITATRTNLLSCITEFCENIILDKFPIDNYVLSRTAKSSYKGSLPEHMVIFYRRNKRVDEGIMQAPKYNVGDRPEFVILYNGQKKSKVSDRVEDPLFMQKFPDGKKTIDRLHYFEKIAKAIVKLAKYHIPDIHILLETTKHELQRRLLRTKNVSTLLATVTRSKRKQNDTRVSPQSGSTEITTSIARLQKDVWMLLQKDIEETEPMKQPKKKTQKKSKPLTFFFKSLKTVKKSE